jgi:hypothetical protein
MRRLFIILLTVLFGCSTVDKHEIDIPEITKQELHEHISFLASDSLKGRKPGTPEGKIASEYIGDFFKQLGYKPLNNDYYQYFEVVTEVVAGEETSLSFGDYQAVLFEDFTPFNFSASGEIEAPIVFPVF